MFSSGQNESITSYQTPKSKTNTNTAVTHSIDAVYISSGKTQHLKVCF